MNPAFHPGRAAKHAWKAGFIDHIRTIGMTDAIFGRAEKAVYASPNQRVATKLVRKIIEAERLEFMVQQEAHDALDAALGLTEQIIDWMGTEAPLKAAAESVFHEVFERPVFRQPKIGGDGYEAAAPLSQDHEVFLVQHDWAALMAPADIGRAAFRLPADRCCFEFNFSGRRVIGLFSGMEGESTDMTVLVGVDEGWFQFPPTMTMAPGDFGAHLVGRLVDQVQAICVGLDVEITQIEAVRADHDLNEERAQRGRGPVFDHHILSLVPRRRYAPRPLEDDRVKIARRWHSRRGHWRRFATFKTWVRWHLVGNPDLGFADKDYRL